jgi:hypothetical protein
LRTTTTTTTNSAWTAGWVARRCTGDAAATYDIQYIDDSEAHGLSFVLVRALDDQESEAVTGMTVTQSVTPVEVDVGVSAAKPGDLVLAQKGSTEKWFMALISSKYVLQTPHEYNAALCTYVWIVLHVDVVLLHTVTMSQCKRAHVVSLCKCN